MTTPINLDVSKKGSRGRQSLNHLIKAQLDGLEVFLYRLNMNSLCALCYCNVTILVWHVVITFAG